MEYKVKLKKTEEGFSIWCPGLPKDEITRLVEIPV